MKKYALEIVVFLAGLAVMILELDGSRIFAPYFGTSLYVWTSLIGVILGSLSLGYYLGGKLADKKASFPILAAIIFVAAAYVGLSALVKEPILRNSQNHLVDLRLSTVGMSLLFFLIPNVLLGMVSPYAVKLKMKSLDVTGRTVGNLYAISTVGSIAGTFLAGFYLIPAFGNTQVLFIIAILLAIASVISYFGKTFFIQAGIIVLFIITMAIFSSENKAQLAKGIADIDTEYNRIRIYPSEYRGQQIRILSTDPFGIQSAVYLNGNPDLVFDYTKFYRLGGYFNPNIKKALMIGGGAYTYPRDFLAKNPVATIDVVEIDSKITQVAREYFNLKDDPRLNIISEDGRTFLNNTSDTYDAILIDAFKSVTPPYQLTTREALEKVKNHLSENGVVMANTVSSLEGPKSKFLAAEYATFKSEFPQVYLFQVRANDRLSVQNVMLVALNNNQIPPMKSGILEFQKDLNNLYQGNIAAGKILTDNFAPVENLTLNLY